MKTLIVSAIMSSLVFALCSCRSAGFEPDAMKDIVTPGVSPDTRVRTWDEEGKPHETKVKNDPAFLYDNQRLDKNQ